MHSIEIDIIDTIEHLHARCLDFRRLAPKSPFLRCAWIVPWIRNYLRDSDAPYVLVARQSDEIVALAPLWRQATITRGRVLQFLGSGEVCTDYVTFPCRPDLRKPIARLFAAELKAHCHEWDRMELDATVDDDPFLKCLLQELAQCGCSAKRRPSVDCWRLALPATWDEYLRSLSKNGRKNIKRAMAVLEDDATHVYHVKDSESLEIGFAILQELHQRRWTSLGHPGCFASDTFARFLQQASEKLLSDGSLRQFWIESHGIPIAAEWAVATDEGVFAYQAGISPDHLHLEPGRVANLLHVKYAIQAGHRFVDFLRGNESYKRLWRATPMACSHIDVIPPKLMSATTQGLIDVGRSLKAMLQNT